MDRIEAMTVFVAVADEGSLSAAGRRLQMPLSSVSRKLADLEDHLGTRLMTRTTRQLTLTDAGRDYLAASRDILDRVAEADLAAVGSHASPRGELVVAAPLMLGRLHVMPVVMEMLALFGDVNVRLMLSDSNANLLEDNIDVAVRVGALPDSGLTARQVGTITQVVCASPAYLSKFGRPLTPADLGRHECVTFEGLSSSPAWAFAGHEAATRVPVRARLRVNTADAAISAAMDGVGITRVLSYQIAPQLARGALVRLLQDYEPAAAPVNLLYARQGPLPAKTRCFLELAADRLTRSLAGS